MNTYQLFMGRDIPSGGVVTNSDIMKFLDRVDELVDGYTYHEAMGCWQGEAENAIVLTIAAPREDVLLVADTYKDMFKQLAVGLVELPAMEFV